MSPLSAIGVWAVGAVFGGVILGVLTSECESWGRFLFGAVVGAAIVTIACAISLPPYIGWGAP